MQKIKSFFKIAFVFALLCAFSGNALADDVVGTYKWTIQYNNGGMSYKAADPTTTITVEAVKATDGSYYFQESGSNWWLGQTIPFTWTPGFAADFPCKYVGTVGSVTNAFVQNCFDQNGYYFPQMDKQTWNFDLETGLDLAQRKNNGFGWFGSGSPSSFSPDMTAAFCFLIKSQEVVTGSTDPEPEPEPGDYPELSAINGTHTLTATVEFTGTNFETYLPSSFDFTIDNDKLQGFFPDVQTSGTLDFPKSFNYDQSIGSAYLKSNTFGFFTQGFSGLQQTIGYLPADMEEWPGEITATNSSSTVTTGIVWHVYPGGNIVIPDFNVVNYANPSNPQIIAKYTNIKVDGYEPPAAADISGEYEWVIQQLLDIQGNTADAVTIKVKVAKAEATEGGDEYNQGYVLSEVGTNYFFGQQIPFSYNDASYQVDFAPYYIGEEEGRPVWFENFDLVGGKPQITEQSEVYFDPATRTFNFRAEKQGVATLRGFGWFFAQAGDQADFQPADEIYKAYIIGVDPDTKGNVGEVNYPPMAQLAGTYTMTADVEITPSFQTISQVASCFPSTKTFEITSGGNLESFIGQPGRTNKLDYNMGTGELVLALSQLGTVNVPNPDMPMYSTYYDFGYTNIEGEWEFGYSAGSQTKPNTTAPWQVSENGDITIPDFAIINFNTSACPIIAKYTNVKLTKEVVATAPVYVGRQFGTFVQKADPAVTYAYDLNYSITYNADQTLSVTADVNFPEGTPIGYTGLNVYIPVGNYNFTKGDDGIYTCAQTFEADTEVRFDFWADMAYGRGEMFVDYTVGSEQAAAPVDKVAGVYELNLQPVNMSGGTADSTPGIKVAFVPVAEAPAADVYGIATLAAATEEATTYNIVELGSSDYLLGTQIPFSYNENTGKATFNSFYAGQMGEDDEYVWLSAFVFNNNITEPQNTYGVVFNTEDGLQFPNNAGLGWFVCSGENMFDAQGLYKAYYLAAGDEVVKGNGQYGDDEPSEGFPTIEDLVGEYSFSSTVNDKKTSYTDGYEFPASFTFHIEDNGDGTIKVPDFLIGAANSYLQATYNQETGEINFDKRNYGYIAINDFSNKMVGFSNGNGTSYNYAMGAGNTFKWQVNADGTITIPEFTVWYTSNKQALAVYAETTVGGDVPSGSIPTTAGILGNYTFKADSFDIENDQYENYFKGAFEFEIVQQDNGRLQLVNFLYAGSQIGTSSVKDNNSIVTYDEETGILTINDVAFRTPAGNGALMGLAPEGQWGGISALTAIKLTMQFNADGTVTMPDFDVITYKSAEITGTIAKYNGITITKTGGGDEGPGEEPGEESEYDFLEGVWTMPEYSLSTDTALKNDEGQDPTYDADARSNNIITFVDNGGNYNLVAEGIDATTLRFKYGQASNNGSLYEMYQIPFTNNAYTTANWDDMTNIDTEAYFDATYDPETKTITFPAGSGVRYIPVNAQGVNAGYVEEAFRFNGTATFQAYTPELVWNTDVLTPAPSGDIVSVTVKKPILGKHLNLSTVAGWQAVVTVVVSTEDGATNPTQTLEAELVNEDGIDYIQYTISGLEKGQHSLSYVINALDDQNEIIATSPVATCTVSFGASIYLSTTLVRGTVTDEGVTIPYEVTPPLPTGFDPAMIDHFEAAFFQNINNDNDVVLRGTATMEWGTRVGFNAKGVITIPSVKAGSYDLYFEINGYNAEGELILTSAGRGYTEFTVTENINYPANSLVFEDFTMVIDTKADAPATTAEVNLSLDVVEPFEYRGFQFEVELPEGLSIDVVAANAELDANVADNGNKVLVYLKEGATTEMTKDLITLTVSAAKDMLPDDYELTISNVIFASPLGQDIKLDDYTGIVTIELKEIPIESITVESVTLMAPSYPATDVEEITSGESLEVVLDIQPEDASTEDLAWSVEPDDCGVSVVYNEETGNYEIVTDGEYEGDDVEVTVSFYVEGNEDVAPADVTFTLKKILLGDSNANGIVTVADVVTTANYTISGTEHVDSFCFPNANVILTEVDGKQVINTDDVTATVSIALGNWNGSRNVRRHTSSVLTNDRLVSDNFKAVENAPFEIGVKLDNTYSYSALQASVIVPEGMKVVGVKAGPRAAAHELGYKVKDGKVNVILYSLSNETFAEGDGALFTLVVTADADCGDLRIEGIHASDAASNGYDLGFEGGLSTSTSGINSLFIDVEEGVRYFDVHGIEVKNPEKGQILIRVEGDKANKVVVK